MIHVIQGFFLGVVATALIIVATIKLADAAKRAEQQRQEDADQATRDFDGRYLLDVIDVLDRHFPERTSGDRIAAASEISHAGGRRG